MTRTTQALVVSRRPLTRESALDVFLCFLRISAALVVVILLRALKYVENYREPCGVRRDEDPEQKYFKTKCLLL